MKSSTAAPSFRNSGFETMEKSSRSGASGVSGVVSVYARPAAAGAMKCPASV
jgi:hypothetical protein